MKKDLRCILDPPTEFGKKDAAEVKGFLGGGVMGGKGAELGGLRGLEISCM